MKQYNDSQNKIRKSESPEAENRMIPDTPQSSGIKKTAGNTFHTAAGRIPYGMMNDYMFRAILQTNNHVLKGLICALLHLEEEQIISVVIQNPIELGSYITDKDFQLDIKVLLNDAAVINLEMQVVNEGNWIERSLSYVCRSFDSLEEGQDYTEVRPVIHIGFLNFSLQELKPEFYASYYFMNGKNHQIYSDKLRISVINLKHIGLATETDKKYGIEKWAGLIKATTWEEIKMLTAGNKYLEEAAESLYQLSAEEKIRQQCEARLDYSRTHALQFRKLKEYEELKVDAKKLREDTKKLREDTKKLREDKEKLREDKEKLREDKEKLETELEKKDVLIQELQEKLARLEAGH